MSSFGRRLPVSLVKTETWIRFHQPKSNVVVPTSTSQQLPVKVTLIILFLTSLLGTLWSWQNSSTDIMTFRSRLPASLTASTRLESGKVNQSSVLTQELTPICCCAGDLLSPDLSHALADYFMNKRNLFNQLFVKKAWGWTSAVTLIYLIAAYYDRTASTRAGREEEGKRVTIDVIGAAKRWMVATVYWFYLTQATWFIFGMGPSISQHILRQTGAKCVDESVLSDDSPHIARCNYWAGGHDVSGHTFLLSFSTLFLITVVTPSLIHLSKSFLARSDPRTKVQPLSKYHTAATLLVVLLAMLWELMLLSTSLLFVSLSLPLLSIYPLFLFLFLFLSFSRFSVADDEYRAVKPTVFILRWKS